MPEEWAFDCWNLLEWSDRKYQSRWFPQKLPAAWYNPVLDCRKKWCQPCPIQTAVRGHCRTTGLSGLRTKKSASVRIAAPRCLRQQDSQKADLPQEERHRYRKGRKGVLLVAHKAAPVFPLRPFAAKCRWQPEKETKMAEYWKTIEKRLWQRLQSKQRDTAKGQI